MKQVQPRQETQVGSGQSKSRASPHPAVTRWPARRAGSPASAVGHHCGATDSSRRKTCALLTRGRSMEEGHLPDCDPGLQHGARGRLGRHLPQGLGSPASPGARGQWGGTELRRTGSKRPGWALGLPGPSTAGLAGGRRRLTVWVSLLGRRELAGGARAGPPGGGAGPSPPSRYLSTTHAVASWLMDEE